MERTPRIAWRSGVLLAAIGGAANGQALRLQYDGPNANDRLGYVRALQDLDGDGADEYMLGAPGLLNSDGYEGVVTVYSGLTGTTMFEFRGDSHAFDFGYALDSAGDFNGDAFEDFIIGDPADDTNGSLAGRLCIRDGLTGGKLHDSVGHPGDRRGAAVCGVGDMSGDGRDDIAFGEPGDDRVLVSYRPTTFTSTLWNWPGPLGSTFGNAMDSAGDADGDGVPDIVIGAPGYDPTGKADVGRAYVYSGATGGLLWSYSGTNSYDYLGSTVAVIGDVDGDGNVDVAIGCDQDDTQGNNTGKVTVHSGPDGSVLYTLYGYTAHEYFGTKVRGVGDVSGDGLPDLAVSTSWYAGVGRITVFSGVDGTPFHDTYDPAEGKRWGNVDAGDFDGDGDLDLILGTPAWPDNVQDNGRVEIYQTAIASWSSYGAGWAGKNGVPLILGVSGPWIGRTVDVFVGNSGGVAGSFALLVLGLSQASAPTNKGGTLLVAPLTMIPFSFPFSTGATLSGLLPDDPALCDFEFFLQAIEVDSFASHGLSFTAGLQAACGYQYH